MNKVSLPEGVFKVNCLTMYKDLNQKNVAKQTCIHTQYWVNYGEAMMALGKLKENNPSLELRSTFTLST